jgi:membrane-associated phospholipid phosphatase
VHYPSDIVGGIIVGGICGIAAVWARDLLAPVLNFILNTARALHLA